MGSFGTIWGPEPFGTFLDHLGPFRAMWDDLGPFETIPDHSRPFGTILDHLGPFGRLIMASNSLTGWIHRRHLFLVIRVQL